MDPNTGTDIVDINANRREDQSMGTNIVDDNKSRGVDNSNIRIANIDRQTTLSNKAYISFFSLCKTFSFSFFFWIKNRFYLYLFPHCLQ